MMIALIQKLRAADTLAKLKHLEAKPHLSPIDRHRRDTYVATLVGIGAPAVPLLVRKLAGVNAADSFGVVSTILEGIGDSAVPYLGRAMHDQDSCLRHHAISLLGRIATESALRQLEDESVDLVDRDAIEAARLEARHRHQSAAKL